jgi:TonB family protein
VWVGALVLASILPACALSFPALSLLPSISGSSHASGQINIGITEGVATGHGLIGLPSPIITMLAILYGCTVLFFVLRFVRVSWMTLETCRRGQPMRHFGAFSARMQRFRDDIDSLGVQVMSSPAISGPAVLGFRRPILLLPSDFADDICEHDLHAALAHEFAHIRRHDFLKDLCYKLLCLPVSFHPVTWFLHAQVAVTREMVCDEIAAQTLEERTDYAKSLLRLATVILNRPQSTYLHAIGIFDANALERRVMNLTMKPIEIKGVRRAVCVGLCSLLASVACGSALALHIGVEATNPPGGTADQPQKSSTTPVHIIHRVAPVYPAEAKANKDTIDGACILAVSVNEDGVPTDISVAQSLRADYDKSAIDAVRQWRFSPAMKDGKPIAVETKVEISYSMTK